MKVLKDMHWKIRFGRFSKQWYWIAGNDSAELCQYGLCKTKKLCMAHWRRWATRQGFTSWGY